MITSSIQQGAWRASEAVERASNRAVKSLMETGGCRQSWKDFESQLGGFQKYLGKPKRQQEEKNYLCVPTRPMPKNAIIS